MTTIGDALFTKTQQKVLGLLFGKPDKRYYTNEIMRTVNMGRGTVSRELERLVSSGLILLTQEGNQKYYQANSESPVFPELCSIVKKSFGIADLLKQALLPIDQRLITAFVYGSISKGLETAESDIDLMLIGANLEYSVVMNLLLPLEESIGRTINPTLYSEEQFNKRSKEGNSFLIRVLEQPKLMIKGVINDLGKSSHHPQTKTGEPR